MESAAPDPTPFTLPPAPEMALIAIGVAMLVTSYRWARYGGTWFGRWPRAATSPIVALIVACTLGGFIGAGRFGWWAGRRLGRAIATWVTGPIITHARARARAKWLGWRANRADARRAAGRPVPARWIPRSDKLAPHPDTVLIGADPLPPPGPYTEFIDPATLAVVYREDQPQ